MSIKGAHNTHCLVVENEEDLKDIYIYIYHHLKRLKVFLELIFE